VLERDGEKERESLMEDRARDEAIRGMRQKAENKFFFLTERPQGEI
jgi:hypothetical protein